MERIELLLRYMGQTPEAVADSIRAAGVQGRRNSTSHMNPLVRYLNRKLDIGGRLEVSFDGTVLRLYRGGKMHEYSIPVSVQGFLNAFHSGLYSDLDAVDGMWMSQEKEMSAR